MTYLYDLTTGEKFDIPEDFVVPVDLVNSILQPSSEGAIIIGGGTIDFAIPKTDKNRRLIGEDVYTTMPVRLTQGSRVMNGDLRVLSESRDSFDAQIDDPVSVLFDRLKTVPLASLYWEDLNHTWSFANIVSDRSAGWVYGIEDRGTFRTRPNLWAAPRRRLAPFGVEADAYNFFPGIFLFEYIQRMFDYLGIELDSTLIENQSWFKRLYIPFPGGEIRKAPGVADGASGLFYDPIPDDIFTLEEALIDWDGTNNPTNFDTATEKYTATTGGLATVKVRIGFVSTGTNAPSLGFRVILRKNGAAFSNVLTYTVAGSSNIIYADYSVDVAVEVGDVITAHYIGSTGLFGPYGNLQITIEDRLYLGDTIEMRNFVPNLMCADLLKWTISTFNLVPRPDRERRLVRLETFNQSFDPPYTSTQPITIDIDSIQYTGISNLARQNFMGYNSDTNYGNGGFTINDDRLEPELSLLQNGFTPTQMRTWLFNGRMIAGAVLMEDDSVYPMYQKTPAGDDVLYFTGTIPNIGIRLLFMARVDVADLFNDGTTGLQIGDTEVTSVNWPYFYNPINQINTPLSLSFRDEVLYVAGAATDAEGLNLTEFCFSEYAKDFQKFREFTALAALTEADFESLNLATLYPVPQVGGYYRIIQVWQFTGIGMTEITMRRVNAFDNSSLLTVGDQTGKSSGNTGAPNNGQDNSTPIIPQVAMSRVMAGFASVGAYFQLSIALADNDFAYPVVGFWGDYVTEDQFTVPNDGYYQINFQVTVTDIEAGFGELKIWYEVLDNATDLNVIYRRYSNDEAQLENITTNVVNEESLTAGNLVRFYVDSSEEHDINTDQEYSFVTIAQRPDSAINNTP